GRIRRRRPLERDLPARGVLQRSRQDGHGQEPVRVRVPRDPRPRRQDQRHGAARSPRRHGDGPLRSAVGERLEQRAAVGVERTVPRALQFRAGARVRAGRDAAPQADRSGGARRERGRRRRSRALPARDRLPRAGGRAPGACRLPRVGAGLLRPDDDRDQGARPGDAGARDAGDARALMALTRRQFIQRGAIAGAAIPAPHPLLRAMLGAGTAHAAPGSPILVVVQLEGGNDGLNTVIPVDGAQRGLYDTARPSIGVPVTSLGATRIDNDPVTGGGGLALHPSMSAWKPLYAAGRVASIHGTRYPDQNLAHFRSEEIWFGADPVAPFSDGWFGRYLESAFTPSDLVSVDVDSTLSPIFVAAGANTLAVRRLADFTLPDDPFYPDLAAKKLALDALYDVEANPGATSGLQHTIGASGDLLLSKIDDYALVPTSWSSGLDGLAGNSLARRLKQVASILRYDAGLPASPTAARFFHVRLGAS